MAIYVIDKIKQKNDGDFFLMDAEDVEYNGKALPDAMGSLGEVATDEEVEEMLDDVFGDGI